MKTQTLDLNKMGLAPMQSSELQEVDGGGFWEWLAEKAADLAIDLTIEGVKRGYANNIGSGGSAGVPGGGVGFAF